MPTLSAGSASTVILQVGQALIVTTAADATASVVEVGAPGDSPAAPFPVTASTSFYVFATTAPKYISITAAGGEVTYSVAVAASPLIQSNTNALTLEGFGITPQIISRVARGTRQSPSATQSGDVLFILGGRSWVGAGFSTSTRGSLRLRAAENHTESAQGSYWELLTVAAGATSQATRLTVASDGKISLGAIAQVPEYADDAAAQAGGLAVGAIYRTASVLKVRAA